MNFSSKSYPADSLPSQIIAILFLYFLPYSSTSFHVKIVAVNLTWTLFLSCPSHSPKTYLGTVSKNIQNFLSFYPLQVYFVVQTTNVPYQDYSKNLKKFSYFCHCQIRACLAIFLWSVLYSKVILTAIPLLVTLCKI